MNAMIVQKAEAQAGNTAADILTLVAAVLGAMVCAQAIGALFNIDVLSWMGNAMLVLADPDSL